MSYDSSDFSSAGKHLKSFFSDASRDTAVKSPEAQFRLSGGGCLSAFGVPPGTGIDVVSKSDWDASVWLNQSTLRIRDYRVKTSQTIDFLLY